MKFRAAKIASLILSLFLTAGVMTIFRACGVREDGSYMHCHTAQMEVFYIGIALSVLSLLLLLVKSGKLAAGIALLQALLGILAALVPGTITGMCLMRDMRCWSVMKPAVTVIGIAVIILDLIHIAAGLKTAGRP